MVTATTFTLFKANTKVAAVGRHHRRGAAASGRSTSFAVSFVLALNRVNVVAVTTILALHVGVIGRHVPRHFDFMFPRFLYVRACAQGGSGDLSPRAEGLEGPFAPPGKQEGFGGGTPGDEAFESRFGTVKEPSQAGLKLDFYRLKGVKNI